MKNLTMTACFCFLTITFFTQGVFFELTGDYMRPIRKTALDAANQLGDLTEGYPSNWLDEYVSVEVSGYSNGKFLASTGSNEILNMDQKNILKSADMGSNVSVDVKYKTLNSVTGNIDLRNMSYILTVIPEKEAKYKGGEEQLKKYLKDNAISKVSNSGWEHNESAVIIFSISAQGNVSNVTMTISSGDTTTDKILLDAILKMPQWIPAQNAAGVKVQQEFKFHVGNGGC